MRYLAKNLKWLRELNGLKQSELFAKIGFKSTTWNNYEKGVSKPGLDDLIKISKFFGYSESELLNKELNQDSPAAKNRALLKNEPEQLSVAQESDGEYKRLCEIKDMIIEDKERIIAAQKGEIDALRLALQLEHKIQEMNRTKK